MAESSSDAALKDAINEYASKTGIRRVTLVEKLSVVPIKDRFGRIYKAFKPDGNYCYDIWANGDKWEGKIVSRFEANTQGANKSKNILMRLIVGDTVCRETNSKKDYLRLVKMSLGRITFAPIFEAGALKTRDSDPKDPFKYITMSPNLLKQNKVRLIHVDECGFVYDPGFKEK